MKQTKQDAILASLYSKVIVQMVAEKMDNMNASNDDDPLHLNMAKGAIWKVVNELVRGDMRYHAPSGKTFSLKQVKDMLDKANSKNELNVVYDTLEIGSIMGSKMGFRPYDRSLN